MLHMKLVAFEERRATSVPLPKVSGAYTSSNLFRGSHINTQYKARSWDHLLSFEGARLSPATLKGAAGALDPTKVISLGVARPSSQYFPWQSMLMRSGNADNSCDSHGSMLCIQGEEKYDLALALNYGHAAGSPQILRFITEHVELVHNPVYQDWECCMTCGTTSAIEIALRLLCDRGDWILAESHTYPGTIEVAKAQGLNVMGVDMDGFGLRADHLNWQLENWDSTRGKKPSILYTIPSGQNPTGTTQSTERRKAIYEVAESHDLYIVEDDPYFYLQLDGDSIVPPCMEDKELPADRYLRRLPVSYLSLDRSGRVLRLDTASKILAPGLRCGWLTGCSQIVNKFLAYTELSTTAPSGPSQVMLHKLLDERWGHQGFFDWLIHLSTEYQLRRDVLLESCQRYLPQSVCRWNDPNSGMFLWVKIDVARHPNLCLPCYSEDAQKLCSEVEDRIHTQAKANGVLVGKGSWFSLKSSPSLEIDFRLTFAAAPMDDLKQAVARFGAAIRSDFMLD